ncbi:hypothetical protein [Pantoea ananatis]|uniref:hypothetical protein n=1 Tax=Pantoea ananas TaxID=553 RepID=UPI000E248A2A|nr:hypothetical protein [Pantoea ananatis]REE77906.1 hypothetical protein C7424_0927 [Pantoea ananatis]BBL31224.1 hypothetical protein PAFU01_26720 [Pantoea ananatis]
MKVLGGFAILLILMISAYFGQNVPFANQWPLFEALRTTASIIFAVVGAWFAIIYPERLKKSFRGGGSGSDINGSGITRLFTPIVHSTVILASILVIGVAAPIIKQFSFVIEYKEICRGFSYTVLVFLTLWQLLTVLYSLIGPDMVKRHNSAQERAKQAADSIMPTNSQKK